MKNGKKIALAVSSVIAFSTITPVFLNTDRHVTYAATTEQTLNTATSIVDWMKANNMDSSFENRLKLAANHGIVNFRGTALQNVQLLSILEGNQRLHTTTSIVDWMKANGMDSSFENRKTLAKEHGIKNYRGTAVQNIQLLSILKENKHGNPNAEVVLNTATSIVDWMKANDMDSSFENRLKLANEYGINDYTGTAEQNIKLLGILKGMTPADSPDIHNEQPADDKPLKEEPTAATPNEDKPADEDSSAESEAPVNEEQPSIPVENEQPAKPNTPIEVDQPAEPETPAEPEQPAEPETPAEPEQPVEEPETPAEPEQPVEEPETPAEPEQPVEEPETPAEPEQPVEEPETPVEPEQPVEEPETPAEPEQPVEEPETPAEPEQPVEEPEIPAEPEQPVEEPETPAEPEQPVEEPETPAEPEQPVEEPETPVETTEPPSAANPITIDWDGYATVEGAESIFNDQSYGSWIVRELLAEPKAFWMNHSFADVDAQLNEEDRVSNVYYDFSQYHRWVWLEENDADTPEGYFQEDIRIIEGAARQIADAAYGKGTSASNELYNYILNSKGPVTINFK